MATKTKTAQRLALEFEPQAFVRNVPWPLEFTANDLAEREELKSLLIRYHRTCWVDSCGLTEGFFIELCFIVYVICPLPIFVGPGLLEG